MSVVLVTGGTGTLGRLVVSSLQRQDHDVRVLSRRDGADTYVGNLSTGEGIARATSGVELVVHAASDTHRFGRADLEQTRNLLRVVGGVHHLVYVSIVGIDAIPFGYYRRKLDCEREIAASDVPHTILRATQFHEIIAMLLGAAAHLPVAPLPVDFRFQSVAAREVADRLVELLSEEPSGRAYEFGGPAVLELGEMARVWRDHRGHPKRFVRLPIPGAVADAFRRGRNTCPDHAVGRQSWAEFARLTERDHKFGRRQCWWP